MSPCHPSFEWRSGSYGSKVTPVDLLDAEKTLEPVFLYVFRIAFTASLFWHLFVWCGCYTVRNTSITKIEKKGHQIDHVFFEAFWPIYIVARLQLFPDLPVWQNKCGSQDFLRTFSELSQDFLRTFLGISQDFPRTFSGLSQDFLKTVSVIFLGLFQNFLTTLSGLSYEFLRTLSGHSQEFPRTFPGLSQDFSGLSQDFPWTFPDILWNFSKFLRTFSEISPDFRRTFSGLSLDIRQKYPNIFKII